ncbi:TolC family protein [Acinetobacter tandoii]|uniref:TolC family protein n=2 Tax=Moraxellaceae TaxID=468 RepID=A0A5N4WP66_9GAMM|nr:TolC family protein [Acinetobacter sp. ACNIH2]KAB1858040.1 TolC family protein [Acinetobacter tandoii]
MPQRFQLKPRKLTLRMNPVFPSFICLCTSMLFHTPSYAKSISYIEAEQNILTQSYSTRAAQALQQSAQLQAEAVKGLGLPRIDLNVRAYAFHNEVDVPLNSLKNNLDNTLTQGVNNQIDQWQNNSGIPSGITDTLKDSVGQVIDRGVGLIPNEATVNLDDQVVRPTVSVFMPLYTGGLTSSAKQMAQIQSERSVINNKQQQDLQRFEIIQAYFNSQLQTQLLAASRFNAQAMQTHYQNALKLEQQGFISKGQRMQFEVAKNNAERLAQNAQANLQASLFQLNNLLQSSEITELSTPLFINTTQNHSINQLLKSYPEQSSLVQKLQKDTELAGVKVKAESAAKKPTVFAFGEYSLDEHQNWIVGIAAQYNLFSGIDKQKNIQAAELQRYALQLTTERTKQEIENMIYKSYSELETAQQSHVLLQQNMLAAQENLRIQTLSFKEDMGTATQVIDAQNAMTALKSEMALNAYKYVMSLATLLQSHGSIAEFQSYVNQKNTQYIR